MVLESTIICVDNSEFMRNGDFLPSRLQAQQDAVSLITQSKLRSNPESNVGLLTLGGLEVLTTLTTDTGKILAKLHAVQPTGKLRLIQGIKIAHLALKHRQGKNHRTRIVMFIGSPVEADEKELIRLAKKLKKEKVNVDVVNFGEDGANTDVLKKFVETVNGRDGSGSHLVTIPTGPHLSDALVSSAIVQGEDGSGSIAAGGGFEFGVDPNEDPELALALRVSMEEQRARQEAEAAGAKEQTGPSAASGSDADQGNEDRVTDDDAMLQKALAMSMEMDQAEEPDFSAMTEEEQIAYAMRMSMQDQEQPSAMEVEESVPASASTAAPVATQSTEEDYSEAINDPAFLQSVLESLPGVDPNSAAIQQAMEAMVKKDPDSKDKREDKGKDK